MFERYTEKARRVIFFARYEASQYGAPYIETEHLLLGLLRDNPKLVALMPAESADDIRKRVDECVLHRPPVSTSVDLPLSNESKRVLAYAAEEAERLAHRHIGSEHLLLGLMREKNTFAEQLLLGRGLDLGKLREKFAKGSSGESRFAFQPPVEKSTVQIHGSSRYADDIRARVNTCRAVNWYWDKKPWKPLDLVVRDGRLSFDVSLAADKNYSDLRPGGWTKETCAICAWELIESKETAHSIAYTNGRDWVCSECYEKFLSGPDYFTSSHEDIT